MKEISKELILKMIEKMNKTSERIVIDCIMKTKTVYRDKPKGFYYESTDYAVPIARFFNEFLKDYDNYLMDEELHTKYQEKIVNLYTYFYTQFRELKEYVLETDDLLKKVVELNPLSVYCMDNVSDELLLKAIKRKPIIAFSESKNLNITKELQWLAVEMNPYVIREAWDKALDPDIEIKAYKEITGKFFHNEVTLINNIKSINHFETNKKMWFGVLYSKIKNYGEEDNHSCNNFRFINKENLLHKLDEISANRKIRDFFKSLSEENYEDVALFLVMRYNIKILPIANISKWTES